MKKSAYIRPSLLAALLAALFFAPSVWAGPGRGKGPPPDSGMGRGQGPRSGAECRMVDELKLSADQIEKLRKIREEGRKDFDRQRDGSRERMEKVRTAHEKLNEALKGTAADRELRKLFSDFQDARKALHEPRFDKVRFEEVLKIRAILTPEQRQKFKGLPFPAEGRGLGPFSGPGWRGGPPESESSPPE